MIVSFEAKELVLGSIGTTLNQEKLSWFLFLSSLSVMFSLSEWKKKGGMSKVI